MPDEITEKALTRFFVVVWMVSALVFGGCVGGFVWIVVEIFKHVLRKVW